MSFKKNQGYNNINFANNKDIRTNSTVGIDLKFNLQFNEFSSQF